MTAKQVSWVLTQTLQAVGDVTPGYGYLEPEKNLAAAVLATALQYAAVYDALLEAAAVRLNKIPEGESKP